MIYFFFLLCSANPILPWHWHSTPIPWNPRRWNGNHLNRCDYDQQQHPSFGVMFSLSCATLGCLGLLLQPQQLFPTVALLLLLHLLVVAAKT